MKKVYLIYLLDSSTNRIIPIKIYSNLKKAEKEKWQLIEQLIHTHHNLHCVIAESAFFDDESIRTKTAFLFYYWDKETNETVLLGIYKSRTEVEWEACASIAYIDMPQHTLFLIDELPFED